MSKTTEELYEERLETAVHHLISEFFTNDLDYISVVESLEEHLEEDDPDFQEDAYDRVSEEINDLYQRWLDSDN